MSKMNRFFAKIGHGFKKVGAKVEGTYDSAAESVRAKGLEIRIDEQYENLGRIVYRDLHTEEDLEEMKLEVVAKIDALFDELEQIKAAKEARKAKKEENVCACDCECDETACECECECEQDAEESEKVEQPEA